MFGFPSYYNTPQRSSYDPFGGLGSYGRPAQHQQPTYRNPYGYQYDPRYHQEDSDEEEEQYTRPQRVAPQQQVRLDHLTPQQKYYLQQQQQKQQEQLRQQQLQRLQREQQLREEQDEEEEEEQEDYHQHQHKHHYPHQRQQSAQHHRTQRQAPPQQHARPQPQQRQRPQPQQPARLKEVDLDKEALRIQRRWRGWQVRRHDILAKLRALEKINGEVDEIVATPINQQILGLNPSEPLPVALDTYYVGHIPRNVLALEHALTAKLIALDGISGASDIIRPRRKGLVSKIEGILSRVDAIKKVYATMTPPPNPTPVISTPDEHHAPTEDPIALSKKKVTESSDVAMESEETEETDSNAPTASESSDSNELASNVNSMDIQDVSDSTPSSSAPTITPPSSTTSAPKFFLPPTPPNVSRVPTLKHMCFTVCDSLIKQRLVVH